MVYVDPLRPCIPNKNWKYTESAHLIADDVEELHAFAFKLGLKRSWFQNHKRLPHYDLTKNMRQKAVNIGATEITIFELARRLQNYSSS